MNTGYDYGHPWHYVLGGRPPGPKDILRAVRAFGYRGYRSDIDDVDRLPEPKRSEVLRRIETGLRVELSRDIASYRAHIRELPQPSDPPACTDAHVSVSLKHNHIYNDLAHLDRVRALLSVQSDLFS